ncbi:MAG: outer membrane lipoprotein carrier protein LolA [Candidatus Saganbacteria bacterium]|nr:outer membrane lipoprotein carrier protein LolA [Candidatus Saganbacteria bacterium]
MIKGIISSAVLFLLLFSTVSYALTIEQLIEKVKVNQAKILDMKAEITTTMTSNIQGNDYKLIQKGKLWTKNPNKSKIEVLSPVHQITITNGNIITVVSPDSGQKMVQDISEMKGKTGMPDAGDMMNISKALEYFNLTTAQTDTGAYLITGTPKEKNDFLGKMEFLLDPAKYVFTQISIFNPQGGLISLSKVEYANISNCWVPMKNNSTITMPTGGMNMEMVFENLQVNKGIADTEFEVK